MESVDHVEKRGVLVPCCAGTSSGGLKTKDFANYLCNSQVALRVTCLDIHTDPTTLMSSKPTPKIAISYHSAILMALGSILECENSERWDDHMAWYHRLCHTAPLPEMLDPAVKGVQELKVMAALLERPSDRLRLWT